MQSFLGDNEKTISDKLISSVEKVFIFTENDMFSVMEECYEKMMLLENEMKDFASLAEQELPNYGNKKKVEHFKDLSV